MADPLSKIDYFDTLIDAEDFISGLISIGVHRKSSTWIAFAVTSFFSSIVGRMLANTLAQVPKMQLMTSDTMGLDRVAYSALIELIMEQVVINNRLTAMNNLEKAILIQYIGKYLGTKLQLISKTKF